MLEIPTIFVKTDLIHGLTYGTSVYGIHVNQVEVLRNILAIGIDRDRCATGKNYEDAFFSQVRLNECTCLGLRHFLDGFHKGLPRRLGLRLFMMSLSRTSSG
jgi:hypothetical protein